MKVALMTTWDERCGIAEYSKMLVASLQSQVQFKVFDRDQWDVGKVVASDCDVFHLNYEAGLFGWLGPADVSRIKASGKRAVMTLQSSFADNRSPLTLAFDKVVVHSKGTTDGFEYIPQGIMHVDGNGICAVTKPDALGTAGFPFPHKGFREVAQASAILGKGCCIIAPTSGHADTDGMELAVRAVQPNVTYVKDYLPQEDVVRLLRISASVMVFAYQGIWAGISGAVRMGLATGRPVVVTRCNQFADLFDYEDEIEFSGSHLPEDLAAAVTRVLENGKVPNRVLKDFSWTAAAQRYLEVYQG